MMTPDMAGEAETLVRALAGVVDARIHASGSGIDAIHVTATDPDTALHMAAHVRSALLAGLAAPVLPGRIHVQVASDPGAPDPDASRSDTSRSDASRSDDDAPEPHARHRLRLLQNHAVREPKRADSETAAAREPLPGLKNHADPAEAPSIVGSPRLVSVEADRPGDGRVLCHVAIAFQTRVHRAEAVAVDLPGAAAQAAAQATVRALIDAGIPGLELSGLREVEIAGRDYVLVALRRTEPYTRTRSGSAPIVGSPERSAAEATVAAAHDMT